MARAKYAQVAQQVFMRATEVLSQIDIPEAWFPQDDIQEAAFWRPTMMWHEVRPVVASGSPLEITPPAMPSLEPRIQAASTVSDGRVISSKAVQLSAKKDLAPSETRTPAKSFRQRNNRRRPLQSTSRQRLTRNLDFAGGINSRKGSDILRVPRINQLNGFGHVSELKAS
jgi:hypothetical protein